MAILRAFNIIINIDIAMFPIHTYIIVVDLPIIAGMIRSTYLHVAYMSELSRL